MIIIQLNAFKINTFSSDNSKNSILIYNINDLLVPRAHLLSTNFYWPTKFLAIKGSLWSLWPLMAGRIISGAGAVLFESHVLPA